MRQLTLRELGDTTTARWGDAIEAVERCYELGWTDGLPVAPPTDYRVAQFLDYVGRDAAEVVGELPERRRQDRKSTRLNSSHIQKSRMPSSA